MVANKYAFLQITRRQFLNEWEAFKKVISRRNIRRRITIPLTLSNLKLLRRITRTENILHRNFTRRQVAIRSEERFSRNAESDLVCRLLLEKNYPRSRRHRRKRRGRYRAIQPGNRLASDSTARSQSRAGHMVSSENLCSPRELSRSRSRRRHSNETIRWRKACPVRRRRSDIPSLCG